MGRNTNMRCHGKCGCRLMCTKKRRYSFHSGAGGGRRIYEECPFTKIKFSNHRKSVILTVSGQYNGFLYTGKPSLVILCVDLEVALGMIADRAFVGGIGSHNDMSAVSALPYLYFALCEDSSGLHIF